MFRFWAGATAGLLVGSFAISGSSAEGLGSTIAPHSSSQPTNALVFAAATFSSSHDNPVSFFDRLSGTGLANASNTSGDSPSLAFIDFAYTSPYGAGWSPLNSVLNSTPTGALQLTSSRTVVDTYFNAFESLSNPGLNGPLGGGVLAAPVSRTSVSWTMR